MLRGGGKHSSRMRGTSDFGMWREPSPVPGGTKSPLWVPTGSRPFTASHQEATSSIGKFDITDVKAISLPEEFLPIVKGLAQGKSDVTVSRLLDMSPRTFSRRVAELLVYLEVETRFQAGMEVAHRIMLSSLVTRKSPRDRSPR